MYEYEFQGVTITSNFPEEAWKEIVKEGLTPEKFPVLHKWWKEELIKQGKD